MNNLNIKLISVIGTKGFNYTEEWNANGLATFGGIDTPLSIKFKGSMLNTSPVKNYFCNNGIHILRTFSGTVYTLLEQN